ncbi:LysR family transcriptional regulator [Streptomyces botrytidirepellens]|uniref:LysR family transcriptional regulator n=1 Tax=Streptomyces botrytidirepellens TaxID=2486417 RepID=A0A3M8SBR7_9ACTN|nr:LysR substrate-binding domain-containing protein [Streptomyces botrytidirepellens]RNF78233.1 LysR family transcriptional regulator [Streptomyces botrytidirepellens]
MDLRLVAYFVAVIDHGSVTKAAQALYIAQPSLSQAIRSLERQLGVQLFDRSGRRLTLTAGGRSFAGPARQILADVERARSKAHAVRDLVAGRLELAVLSTLSADPLPELTSRLHRAHPDILVTVLDPGSSSGVVSQVRQGQAELGLTDFPVKSDTLQTHELWDQEIALVLPPDLAAGLPDPVPLEALEDIPLVLESSGSGSRAAIDEAVERSIACVAVECAHRQAIWELVMHGGGATFLPRQIAESELRDVVVRSMAPQIRRAVGLVFRPGRLSPAATAFMNAAEAMRRER